MRQLGFGPFQLVGHDRGARVSHRLALDHPEAVTRLAVLDIVPTRHVLNHVTRTMATAYYHWFFLPAGNGIPERMIGADPGFWIRSIVGPLLGKGASIDAAAMADYIRCFSDPGTIAGSCADYRSAAGIDLVHDDETFAAGQKLECPVLVLWGAQGFVGREYEPLSVWREYAGDVRGEALPTGHFLPEEAPDLVIAALRDFLSRGESQMLATIDPMVSADLAHDDAAPPRSSSPGHRRSRHRGDGPAVVLIHGHPFNRSMWAPQLAALRDRFRVIVPDLRGYGDSPVDPPDGADPGPFPLAARRSPMSAYTTAGPQGNRHRGGDRPEHGRPGRDSRARRGHQPDRWWACGCRMVATTAARSTAEERAARLASARTLDEQGMRPVAEEDGRPAVRPGNRPGTQGQHHGHDAVATNPAGAAAVRGRAERPDYQPVLTTLGAPALVLTGDHDSYSDREAINPRSWPAAWPRSRGRPAERHRPPAQPRTAGGVQPAPAQLPHPRSPVAWPHAAQVNYEQWRQTCDTLHAHTQVLGKLAVKLAPPEPQLQHAALRLTARGWETAPLPAPDRSGALVVDA